MEVQLNYLAVIAAVVCAQVLGALWYSRALFGRAWMNAVGRTEEQIKQGPMAPKFIGAIGLSLLMAFVLAHFIGRLGVESAAAGIECGLWLWLGFVVATMGVNHLFQGSPLKLFLIDGGYHLVSLLAMGAVLGAWR